MKRLIFAHALILTILKTAAPFPANPITVIVFPLENVPRTASLAWVGEGIALSVSEQIRMPGIDVIDRADRIHLIESADLPPNVPLSRASMIRIGQLASADLVVMGTYSGTSEMLQIVLSVFDQRKLKLGGEFAAKGPLNALAEMENELAWNVLSNTGLNAGYSREQFKGRMRVIPNSSYSCYLRSLQSSDEAEQIKLLDMAVSLYRDFPDAQFLLGRLYFQAGQCLKAIEHLELGRKKDRSYVRGDFMLGTCYFEGNAISDAIRCYTNLLSFGRPIEALNNLGVAYMRMGDYPLALQHLLEAHRLAQNNQTVAINLALVRHLQGDDSAARTVLDEPIRVHPSNGMLQYVLSLVLKALGDENGAASALALAASLHVDLEKVQSQDAKTLGIIFPTLEPRP